MAQSVGRPTPVQVMISRSVSSSPASGSVLTAQSLEPASDSVSPSLSDLPPFMLCLSYWSMVLGNLVTLLCLSFLMCRMEVITEMEER